MPQLHLLRWGLGSIAPNGEGHGFSGSGVKSEWFAGWISSNRLVTNGVERVVVDVGPELHGTTHGPVLDGYTQLPKVHGRCARCWELSLLIDGAKADQKHVSVFRGCGARLHVQQESCLELLPRAKVSPTYRVHGAVDLKDQGLGTRSLDLNGDAHDVLGPWHAVLAHDCTVVQAIHQLDLVFLGPGVHHANPVHVLGLSSELWHQGQ